MPKLFQRTVEDFTCGNCGKQVFGNGYTNHCPKCLWSKHVDVNPGDRKSTCHGLMEPIEIRKKDGEMDILHRCVICKHERYNRATSDDNLDIIVELSANI